MQGQEDADTIAFGTDAGHQVAGAFAAEILLRQAQQMFIRGGAQIGADALAHQSQNIGTGPAKAPGHQGRSQQTGQVELDQVVIDRLAVLIRNQHVIHQRPHQIRRHQRGSGRNQHQDETQRQHAFVRLGKTREPEQSPGRRWRFAFFGTNQALIAIRRQRRFALRARSLFFA